MFTLAVVLGIMVPTTTNEDFIMDATELRNEQLGRFEHLMEVIGTKSVLMEILLGMSNDDLVETADHIEQMYIDLEVA